MNCDIAGCSKPYYARGYCGMHYKRLLKWGDPERSDREQRTEIPKPIIHSTYAEIELTKGAFAIVDLDDVWLVSKYFYYLGNNGYATRREGDTLILMHHDIMPLLSDGREIDHDDRNKLNNRKANLIRRTHGENMLNSYRHETAGVAYDKTNDRWKAYIGNGKTRISLGTFRYRSDAEEAVRIAKG